MIFKNKYPILEYSDTRKAVIEPEELNNKLDICDKVVLCFFKEVIEDYIKLYDAKCVHVLLSEAGNTDIYLVEINELKFLLVHPGVGAAYAAGGVLEEIIALGAKKIIACGGGGVLNSEIAAGHLIIPTSAIRDEGTSYHYLPPTREVSLNEWGIKAIEDTLIHHKVPYIKGKTWTTDAFYRETREMVKYRKQEDAVIVEMECAAFAAVAEFRNVIFGQILYGGDDVGGEVWDKRRWKDRLDTRHMILLLAAEAVNRL